MWDIKDPDVFDPIELEGPQVGIQMGLQMISVDNSQINEEICNKEK